jgi:hypothetical protein
MDRRKIIHRICANVMGTELAMTPSINIQASSAAVAAFPSAAADVSAIQSTLSALHTTLDDWYKTWRDTDPVEPPDPAFLGVFGSVAAFQNNLKETDPMMRLVRNDYAAIAMLAQAYEQLYTVALALETDCPGLKTIALDGLKDLVPILESLRDTMCEVQVRDLHNQDGTIPMSTAATAIADIQTAWS